MSRCLEKGIVEVDGVYALRVVAHAVVPRREVLDQLELLGNGQAYAEAVGLVAPLPLDVEAFAVHGIPPVAVVVVALVVALVVGILALPGGTEFPLGNGAQEVLHESVDHRLGHFAVGLQVIELDDHRLGFLHHREEGVRLGIRDADVVVVLVAAVAVRLAVVALVDRIDPFPVNRNATIDRRHQQVVFEAQGDRDVGDRPALSRNWPPAAGPRSFPSWRPPLPCRRV